MEALNKCANFQEAFLGGREKERFMKFPKTPAAVLLPVSFSRTCFTAPHPPILHPSMRFGAEDISGAFSRMRVEISIPFVT
jgi:hypothetical protein